MKGVQCKRKSPVQGPVPEDKSPAAHFQNLFLLQGFGLIVREDDPAPCGHQDYPLPACCQEIAERFRIRFCFSQCQMDPQGLPGMAEDELLCLKLVFSQGSSS